MLGVFGQTGKNNELSKKEIKQGWVLLFYGKTTKGWTNCNGQTFLEKGREIKDGILKLADNEKAGDIIIVDEYSDFDFSVDCLMSATCNSGSKYFYYNYPKGRSPGMEFQLLDDKLSDDNKKANHICGSLYNIFPADETINKMNKKGQWNAARIVSSGKHEVHWFNGIKVLEFDRGIDTYLAGIAKSKYKSNPILACSRKA